MFFRKNKNNSDNEYSGRRHVDSQYIKSNVFSYHASRSSNPISTSRSIESVDEDLIKRRKKKFGFKEFAYYFVLVAVLVGVIFNLRLSTNPKVVVIGDSSDKLFLQNTSIYKNAAQKMFKSSVLNQNKATVNASYIAEGIRSQYSELAAVSVTVPLVGSQPTVYLVPTEPKLVLTDGSGQFLVLDSSGTVLTESDTPLNISGSGVPSVVDQGIYSEKIGQLVLSTSNVQFISEVAQQLTAQGINVSSYTIPSGTSELDAQIAGQPYYVKFNLYGNARVEAGTFVAVKLQLSKTNTVPKKYIDVRVNGRAYYL